MLLARDYELEAVLCTNMGHLHAALQTWPQLTMAARKCWRASCAAQRVKQPCSMQWVCGVKPCPAAWSASCLLSLAADCPAE